MIRSAALALLAFAGTAALSATPARAAEAYDNCTGFIDALPAVISTQGVWCLRKDLAGNMETGDAITIGTNNVTIDCNDFKVGNLAASETNSARGVFAPNRNSVTVRRCNLRGFGYGVFMLGNLHTIEHNRFVATRTWGIYLSADGSVVRGNQVIDTIGNGGAGIVTVGNIDILDNVVDTFGGTAGSAWGIFVAGGDTPTVRRNHVRGISTPPPGQASGGIFVDNQSQALVADNYIGSGITAGAGSYGIRCDDADVIVRDNNVIGLNTGIACTDGGGNIVR